jgi:integrase
MNKDWFVYYTFYDPEYPKGIRRQIRGGINYFKTAKERKEMAQQLMSYEMEKLMEGFNPFKREIIIPVNADVTPDTPFITALQICFKKIKAVKGTLVDIQSVIKGTTESAAKLGIDKMPVKNVSRKYFKMIFEQCKIDNPKFSDNRQNVYRKWLKKLYDELIEMEAVEVNPLVFIRKEKTVRKKRVMPTDEQRIEISNYLRKNFYNFWRAVQIFYASGARETELMNVKIKDVDLNRQECKYLVLKRKNEHEVTRPVSDAVLYLWEELIKGADEEDYLFSYDLKPGPKKLSTEALSKRWLRHVKGKAKSRSKYGKVLKNPIEFNIDLYALKYLNTTEIMDILDNAKEVAKLTAHTTEAMIVKIYDTKNKQRKDDKIKKAGSTF